MQSHGTAGLDKAQRDHVAFGGSGFTKFGSLDLAKETTSFAPPPLWPAIEVATIQSWGATRPRRRLFGRRSARARGSRPLPTRTLSATGQCRAGTSVECSRSGSRRSFVYQGLLLSGSIIVPQVLYAGAHLHSGVVEISECNVSACGRSQRRSSVIVGR